MPGILPSAADEALRMIGPAAAAARPHVQRAHRIPRWVAGIIQLQLVPAVRAAALPGHPSEMSPTPPFPTFWAGCYMEAPGRAGPGRCDATAVVTCLRYTHCGQNTCAARSAPTQPHAGKSVMHALLRKIHSQMELYEYRYGYLLIGT